ncbi:MFS transporter [Neobacillus vireti]|uniref:Major facilitator superfamily protein n=1 Tax=Neobacillus vireti LMG 21834 TaxID=1131730 RepID=A0AB94INY5_9BACI|nr:MFS transporter [Neobacillus vireti]ETI68764.1 major facilitator superfamily protein [Neobacillus vireti LMG 21834]KLT18746.1 multidrug MFS transporter [Neobacillus vireti]
MTQPKLWTKDFIMVCLTNLFLSMNFYLLMVIFSEYAVKKFDAPQSLAGLASSIFILGTLCSRPLAGKYLDVIGRKKLLYSSIIVFIVTTILYLVINNLALLLIDRFIHGAALGIAATVIATVMTSSIPRERSGEGIGYFSMSVTIATAVGPFIALLIVQQAGYNMAFLMCVIFAVIGMVLALALRVENVKISKEQAESLKGFKLNDFFEFSGLSMAVLMVILGFAYSSVMTFISSYANEVNLTQAASFFFLVYAVCLLASRPITGKRFDLKGENSVVYPCMILFLAGLVILSQASHGFILLIAGALIGIGYGTTMSCVQTIMVKKAPPHRVGLANSTFFVSFDLGMGIGPFVLGSILPSLGFRGMYVSMAVVVLLCIVYYFFAHGKKVTFMQKSGQTEQQAIK